MRMVSRKQLREAVSVHADLESSFDTWYRVAKSADWKSIEDVRKTYPNADPVPPCTVFNIKGNRYRLIVKIEYRFGLAFIKDVLTRAEYDKGDWNT
jgi:mRNA interferase HigB